MASSEGPIDLRSLCPTSSASLILLPAEFELPQLERITITDAAAPPAAAAAAEAEEAAAAEAGEAAAAAEAGGAAAAAAVPEVYYKSIEGRPPSSRSLALTDFVDKGPGNWFIRWPRFKLPGREGYASISLWYTSNGGSENEVFEPVLPSDDTSITFILWPANVPDSINDRDGIGLVKKFFITAPVARGIDSDKYTVSDKFRSIFPDKGFITADQLFAVRTQRHIFKKFMIGPTVSRNIIKYIPSDALIATALGIKNLYATASADAAEAPAANGSPRRDPISKLTPIEYIDATFPKLTGRITSYTLEVGLIGLTLAQEELLRSPFPSNFQSAL